MTAAEPATRYRERGVSLLWLVPAPVGVIGMIISEVIVGDGGDWWIWLLLGAIGELLVWLQLVAGRTHVSVHLTDDALRCGAETLSIAEIAEILPGSAVDHGTKSLTGAPKWRTARAMGRLGTVPRRRYGVGLRTTDRATLQAWAKNDYALRAQLAPLVAAAEPDGAGRAPHQP